MVADQAIPVEGLDLHFLAERGPFRGVHRGQFHFQAQREREQWVLGGRQGYKAVRMIFGVARVDHDQSRGFSLNS